jgi:hypothetical protein
LICGERKHDAGTLRPCNFNPYCFASLGGIINLYRGSATKARYANRDKAMLCNDLAKQIYDDFVANLELSSLSLIGKIPNNGKRGKGNTIRGSALVDCDAVNSHILRFVACGGFGDIDCIDVTVVDDCIPGFLSPATNCCFSALQSATTSY